jgi:hypothetical protein
MGLATAAIVASSMEVVLLKQILVCIVFVALAAVGSRVAQAELPTRSALSNAAETRVIDHTHVFVERQPQADIEPVADGVLSAISEWLSTNFPLPASAVTPYIELVSPARMTALRYKSMLPVLESAGDAGSAGPAGSGRDVVAVYDDDKEFIYLPVGWSGKSPGEMSILVHEMVHHLQNQGKLKYNCPQEREKLAYAAQSHWLIEFGTSLEEEFGIDPFSLLVKINCFE